MSNCTCGTNTPSGPGGACSSWCDTNQKAVWNPVNLPGSPASAPRVPISGQLPTGNFSVTGTHTIITGTNQNKTANGGKGPVIYDVSGSYFQAGVTNFGHQTVLGALSAMGNPPGQIVLLFDPAVFKELVSKDLIEFHVDASSQTWAVPYYPGCIRVSCCAKCAASSTALKETWIFDLKTEVHTGTIVTREY